MLRDASEEIAEEFFQYYMDLSDKNSSTSIIVLTTGLVVIFIICASFIPIVFGVHKENKQTMSYFGKITIEDIKILIT